MSDFPELGPRLLVIFDGRCGFCNRSVRWFLRRDSLDRMRFIPSESPRAANLLARLRHSATPLATTPDTLVVVRDPAGPAEHVFLRSDAAVILLAALPRPWPTLGAAFGLIPRPIRDLGYRFIARVRYRIWGRYDACPVPTPAERAHILRI